MTEEQLLAEIAATQATIDRLDHALHDIARRGVTPDTWQRGSLAIGDQMHREKVRLSGLLAELAALQGG
jgi:hypothetical protein